MKGLLRVMLLGSLIVASAAVLVAQQPAAPAAPATQQAPTRVTLTVGRSTVLTTDFDITKIAIPNPEIAQATVVAPQEILIDGKTAGTVSLIVWGSTRRSQYDVVVDPGVTPLQRQLQSLFPGEDLRTSETADAVILTGHEDQQR